MSDYPIANKATPMTLERVELKPCPFCGPKPELSGEWPQLFEHRSDCVSEWSVRCGCCGIEIGDEDRDEAIRQWNTRAAIEANEAVVTERVQKALNNARAWVFECWGWLMETDLDMTCPMETDPLDIVEQIDAIIGIDPALNAAISNGDGLGHE